MTAALTPRNDAQPERWARSWCVNPVPFDDNGQPDFDEYQRHVRFVVDGGMRGLIPLGLVGGGLQLPHRLREDLLRATLEAVDPDTVVYASILDPMGAIDMAERFDRYAEIGVDGIYLGTPPLLRSDAAGTLSMYDEALRRSESGIPVVCYDNANFTGSQLGVDSVIELFQRHPGRIVGYKQNDPDAISATVEIVAGRFAVAPPCYDRYTLAGIEGGCTFQAAAGAALVPKAVSTISEHWGQGNLEEVRRLTAAFTPLYDMPDFSWMAESLSLYSGLYCHFLAKQGFRFRPPAPFAWPLPNWLVEALDAAWAKIEGPYSELSD